MSLVPLLLLLAAMLAGIGPAMRWLVERPASRRPAECLLYAGLTGTLALYLALWAADFVGLPWNRGLIVGFLAIAGVFSFVLVRNERATTRLERRPLPTPLAMSDWVGGSLAAAAIAMFALASARLWNLHPDFIYHWGAKAAHSFDRDRRQDRVRINRR